MQKRSIRIIANVGYCEHTSPLFKELGILKIEDIYHKEVAKLVYKYIHNELPATPKHMFTLKNSEIHNRQTRNCNDLHVKKCRTSFATRFISCKGPHIWNSLPISIKEAHFKSIQCFTSTLKTYMINTYN